MIASLTEIAREAGQRLLALQHTNLKRYDKGSLDFATEADLIAQEIILTRLAEHHPGVAVLAEEQEQHEVPPGAFFTIDPLDGTIGYSNGSRSWGVIIGYLEGGTPKAGVMYMPAEDRLLCASAGGGATLNGGKVTLRARSRLNDALAGVDIGAWLSDEQRKNVLAPLIERAMIVRSLGSSTAGLMDLAAGVTSMYVSAGGAKIWDLATGAVMVRECGGELCALNGEALTWDNVYMTGVFAASKSLAEEFTASVRG